MMISIIQEENKPQKLHISDKSKCLKFSRKTFWEKSTTPILRKIMNMFYESVENESKVFQYEKNYYDLDEDEIKNAQPDVYHGLQRLEWEGIIKNVSTNSHHKGRKSKRKREKKFSYALTPFGFQILIDGLIKNQEKLSEDVFLNYWEALSSIFQKNEITDFKILEKICEYYEKKVLDVNRLCVTPKFFANAFTKNKIKSHDNSYRNKKHHLNYIDLINSFHQISLELKSLDNNSKKIKLENRFEKIREENSNLLPMILGTRNYKRLKLTTSGFLQIFDYLYFDQIMPIIELEDYNVFENIRRFDNIRSNYYYTVLKNHIDDFPKIKPEIDFFENIKSMKYDLRKKRKGSISYEKSLNKLKNYLESRKEIETRNNSIVYLKYLLDESWLNPESFDLNLILCEIDSKSFKQIIKAQNELKSQLSYDKSIQRKITFDFYCVYFNCACTIEPNVVSHLDKSIENWYSDQINELSDFISNYSQGLRLDYQHQNEEQIITKDQTH